MIRILPALLPLWPSMLLAAEGDGQPPAALAELPLDSGHLANTAIGLVLVLALIVGLAWLLRRIGGLPHAGKGAVTVLGGISLGARERAVLLQVGETRLLVGVAPGRVQTLHVLAKEEWSGDETDGEGQPGFAQRLKTELKGRRP